MVRRKQFISVALSIVLVVTLFPCAAYAQAGGSVGDSGLVAGTVSAQANKNLQQRGVKFDLKNGKTVSMTRYIGGIGQQGWTAKMSGLKVSKAKKDGYKKATFTVTYKVKKALTKAQAKKAASALEALCDGVNSPNCWWQMIFTSVRLFVVDYSTGMNLFNTGNKADVSVESNWTNSKSKTYPLNMKKYGSESDDWTFSLPSVCKCKVTVTFPEDYENLCIGVGGDVNPKYCKKANSGFTSSPYSTPYWKTSWFKKASKYVHFMRITD